MRHDDEKCANPRCGKNVGTRRYTNEQDPKPKPAFCSTECCVEGRLIRQNELERLRVIHHRRLGERRLHVVG